jgi:hypothetical protein
MSAIQQVWKQPIANSQGQTPNGKLHLLTKHLQLFAAGEGGLMVMGQA